MAGSSLFTFKKLIPTNAKLTLYKSVYYLTLPIATWLGISVVLVIKKSPSGFEKEHYAHIF